MPQHRGEVPPQHRERIIAARDAVAAAQLAFEHAVADALKAGASVREISRETGVSTTTVQKYRDAHGWPTVEQVAAREQLRASHDAWAAMLRTAEAMARIYEEDESLKRRSES